MVKSAGKDFANNYPTTTYKNFIINAPAASIAGPVVNAMLPARSRDKNMLYGSKYADHTQEPSHRPSCMHLVLPACVPLACMRASRLHACMCAHLRCPHAACTCPHAACTCPHAACTCPWVRRRPLRARLADQPSPSPSPSSSQVHYRPPRVRLADQPTAEAWGQRPGRRAMEVEVELQRSRKSSPSHLRLISKSSPSHLRGHPQGHLHLPHHGLSRAGWCEAGDAARGWMAEAGRRGSSR